MEKEKRILDRIGLVEKELMTITERLEEICCLFKELEDLKIDVKGLKMFLARKYPGFKEQFPDITGKLSKSRRA